MLILIVVLSFSITTYAQKNANPTDSIINTFKTYLSKNIRYPAIARENYVQGKMIVIIHLSENKMIDSVYFQRHFDKECEAEVTKRLKNYRSSLMLPESIYTIGLQFFLLDDGKPDSEIKPFDKTLYTNFLFGLHIKAESLKLIKRDTVY